MGTALRHGDVMHATARWCNQAELCTSSSTRETVVDTVAPTLSGVYGVRSSLEAPISGGPMWFQSLDDALFTITLAYDLDSGVDALEASVEMVGLGTNGLAAQACSDGSGISGSSLVYDWTFLPPPLESTSPGNLSMEFALAASLSHNTLYRVLLRATDLAGNSAVSRTSCVLVDRTPPTVAPHEFSAEQVLVVDGVVFARDNSPANRSLVVGATIANDVSGVVAASICCGSAPGLCDVNLGRSVMTSPPLLPANPALSVNVTAMVPMSTALDGAQVCGKLLQVLPVL